jgi:hypothetical protein
MNIVTTLRANHGGLTRHDIEWRDRSSTSALAKTIYPVAASDAPLRPPWIRPLAESSNVMRGLRRIRWNVLVALLSSLTARDSNGLYRDWARYTRACGR